MATPFQVVVWEDRKYRVRYRRFLRWQYLRELRCYWAGCDHEIMTFDSYAAAVLGLRQKLVNLTMVEI